MNRRKQGFTLIELLTVIAILTLLVGILLPSLTKARNTAKASTCLANLKGIGTSFVLYLNENDDTLPPDRLVRPRPTSDRYMISPDGKIAPRWQWFLQTDLGPVISPTPFFNVLGPGKRGFFTDTDVPRGAGSQAGDGLTMSNDLFKCASMDDPEFERSIRDGAYGYNYQYLGNARRGKTPARWDNFAVSMHQIRAPGATVLVADSRGAGRVHGPHSFRLDPPRLAVERNATSFGPLRPGESAGPDAEVSIDDPPIPAGLDPEIYAYSPVEMRHNKRGNVVFLDSHAEAMTVQQLGYELSPGDSSKRIAAGTAVPVRDPLSGTYSANNKLWTGHNTDPIAAAHLPANP